LSVPTSIAGEPRRPRPCFSLTLILLLSSEPGLRAEVVHSCRNATPTTNPCRASGRTPLPRSGHSKTSSKPRKHDRPTATRR
jgi:hypothetical protein